VNFFGNIAQITEEFRGVLLDAYGVFWGGNALGLFPGSEEIMRKLVSQGKIVGILSNTTQLSPKEMDKLNRHGLIQGEHYHFLITSGEITRQILLNKKLAFQTPTNKFFVFGEVHPKHSSHQVIFEGTGCHETSSLEEADFVYIGIPHIRGEDQTDPELFRKEIEKLRQKNRPLICSNPDLYAHEGMPPKAVVRQGSIARMYEEMGGQVFYIGKPYRMAYDAAMSHFEKYGLTRSSDILMVGDTPETDIRGELLWHALGAHHSNRYDG